ncbi:protein sprouty [Drosophila novamexicana]|uniref:protein sprouty n=1 Tax=Drosophila novamexicana TaxID=47314 RepID=UPI0011E5A95F|nr:protein sprouty [Drosophila novamexicana]
MDRRNGGDPLAPPRPPKLLPRVHRPRAPEPTALGGDNSSSSSSSNNNPSISTNTATLATTATTTSNNNNNNNNTISIIPTTADFDDYQIHHLTFLPQRPSSLSRNSSNASSSTATANSSAGSTSSFTRRRPPPPLLTPVGSSSNSSSNSNNNFLSHFQSAEPVSGLLSTGQPPASPVTLAQPRPESERLTNEYVDTPLQHATRSQHPAGQQDNGQTTTHHLLLLPQRQHQQLHHQAPGGAIHAQHAHHHINRLATVATSTSASASAAAATATATGIDGTDGLLHSHMHHTPAQHHPQQQHHHPQQQQQQLNGHTKATPASKFGPPPPAPRGVLGLGFAAAAAAQPLTQPITKQPASGKEHMHALEELLQQQQQQQHHHQQPGGGGQLGAPIVMGGDPSLLNPIVCPRCGMCRCEQCQSPRPLPQTWVCNKTCLCSAESIIDYASCLCCAKALFYHCARDNDMDCDDGTGTPCVDNPCSCGPYKRTQRWGWLGALSIVLPCLWCYWPMRGCIKLCEKCYARFAGRGCRCQGNSGNSCGSGAGGIGSTSSMMPIVPLGGGSSNPNGNGVGILNGSQNGGLQANGKGFEHGCSAASRILRKGDLTPEKRLLDSSPDY